MRRSLFAESCCSTPSAIGFWAAMFGLFFGSGLVLGSIWPELWQYGDTMILLALAAACFVNFRRHRTLHCGLTGPLFAGAALVALLMEAGVWNVEHSILWGVVTVGVVAACLIEWRTVGGS